MLDASQDQNTQELFRLMVQDFNLGELRVIYFDLGIDYEDVPQPATKKDYVLYLVNSVANNQQQEQLLNRLKELRPRTEWPGKFYVVKKFSSSTSFKGLNIENYVREQNVTIHLQTKVSRNHPRKNNELEIIESKVYEKVFAHTKIYGFSALLFCAILPVTLTVWFILDQNIWREFGILSFIPSIVLMLVSYNLIFRVIYHRVQRLTNFYNLMPVSRRERVKGMLLNRSWGNMFWNFICRRTIDMFLETDKRKANRKKKLWKSK